MEVLQGLIVFGLGILFWVVVFKYLLIPVFRWGTQNPETVVRGARLIKRLFRS